MKRLDRRFQGVCSRSYCHLARCHGGAGLAWLYVCLSSNCLHTGTYIHLNEAWLGLAPEKFDGGRVLHMPTGSHTPSNFESLRTSEVSTTLNKTSIMMSTQKKVRVEYNSFDRPVSYACQDLLDAQTNSTLSNIEVEFLYDLAFPSSLDENAARDEIEANVLKHLALYYGLWNGAACNDSPTTGLWVIKATSKPTDTPNPLFGTFICVTEKSIVPFINFIKLTCLVWTHIFPYQRQNPDSCFKLAANSTESCVSYKGFMTVSAIGPENMPEIIEQISSSMSSGAVTADTEMRVAFLGTQVDTTSYTGDGRDNLAAAINDQLTNSTGRDKTWTPIGVLLVLGMCMAFIGVVLVVTRGLRRRRLEGDEENEDDHDEEKDLGYLDNNGGEQQEEEVNLENTGGEQEMKPKQIAL